MRILVLSHYFPPEVNAPANRVFEHARCWAKEGHEVTVVTGVPNHPRGRIFEGYENRWLQEEEREGIRVIRTWMFLTPNSGFFRRTLSYLLFALTAAWASRRADPPDVVVATSPQFFCGCAGALVARVRRAPFVLEVRDLWPDSIVQLGQLRNRAAIALLEALERWLYRRADGAVAVTRAFAEHLAAHGVPRERIEVVYNGIDPDVFAPRPPDPKLLRRYGLEGRFFVAYVGTLGLAHGLDTVVEAAERLRHEPDIAFVFVGDGADRERLEGRARERGLENVHFVGLRPRSEVPAWLASSSLVLVMLRDLAVFETVIPSKLFEVLAQERPVVLAARGEIRRMAEAAGVARVIDPESPGKLAEAVREARRSPEEDRERARAGRRWVREGFARDALAQRMLRFLEATAEGGP